MNTYEQRIEALEAEGMTTSDAQAAIQAEDMQAARKHKHYELAKRAHYNTSFSPDRRGQSFCIGFDKDIATLAALGISQAKIDHYEALVIRRLQVKGRCISSMITGPANFPVARAEKANRAEHTASLAASAYYDKIVKEAKQEAYYTAHPEARPVMSGDADAVERLKARLAALTKAQETMVQANKIIRKQPVDRAALVALLGSEKAVDEILKPDFAGRVGFASYSMSNNRAEMTRTAERIAGIEKRKATTQKEITVNGVRVLENTEEMRLQLFFDGKPAREIISTLKSNGFKWSPKNLAWQRLLNNNCIYSFNNFVLPTLKTIGV